MFVVALMAEGRHPACLGHTLSSSFCLEYRCCSNASLHVAVHTKDEVIPGNHQEGRTEWVKSKLHRFLSLKSQAESLAVLYDFQVRRGSFPVSFSTRSLLMVTSLGQDNSTVGFDWCKRTKEWTVGEADNYLLRSPRAGVHGARAASELSLSDTGWSFRKACILSQQLGDCF